MYDSFQNQFFLTVSRLACLSSFFSSGLLCINSSVVFQSTIFISIYVAASFIAPIENFDINFISIFLMTIVYPFLQYISEVNLNTSSSTCFNSYYYCFFSSLAILASTYSFLNVSSYTFSSYLIIQLYCLIDSRVVILFPIGLGLFGITFSALIAFLYLYLHV